MIWDTVWAIVTHLSLVIGFAIAFIFIAHIIRQRRAPSATIAWLLVVFAFPYVGVPLYLMLGGRKRRRVAALKAKLQRDPASPSSSPHRFGGIEQLLAATGIPPAAGGHRIRLLGTGEEGYAALTDLIDSARTSLHIATFVYGWDDVGRDILDRLTRRAENGVQVRLLLDSVGSRKVTRRRLKRFTQAGGQAAWFMPMFRRWMPTRADLRNHRKIVVADGKTVMAGGTNIASEYIGPTRLPGRWKDLSFLLEGPHVAVYDWIFRNDWAFASGQDDLPDLPLPPAVSGDSSGARIQVAPSGPDVPGDPLYDAILSSLFYARRRIWIVTPYFVPDTALVHAMKLAARRGVDVRILVPRKSNHGITNLARGPYLRELQSAGVTVLHYLPGMMHAKVLVTDETLAMIGSCNLDIRSLFLNYEVAMFVYDAEHIHAVGDWIEELMTHCQAGEKTVRASRDLLENIARMMAPLL